VVVDRVQSIASSTAPHVVVTPLQAATLKSAVDHLSVDLRTIEQSFAHDADAAGDVVYDDGGAAPPRAEAVSEATAARLGRGDYSPHDHDDDDDSGGGDSWVLLANGLRVWSRSDLETSFIFHEIFEAQEYTPIGHRGAHSHSPDRSCQRVPCDFPQAKRPSFGATCSPRRAR
jgi:hypothetical protein